MIQKVGLAPGTSIYTGDIAKQDPWITITTYLDSNFLIETYSIHDDISSIYANLDKKLRSWVHIEPISDQDAISKLCNETFMIHPLVTEDLLAVHHRPKIETYDGYDFIIMKYCTYENAELNLYQISFVVKENQILTFADKSPDNFNSIKKRFQNVHSKLRQETTDYLLCMLLDVLVDYYFVVLEHISDEMDELEDEVLYNPGPTTIEHIHALKKNLIQIKKSIWPAREVINQLLRAEDIEKKYLLYYKDVYDHLVEIIDTIDNYRDNVSSFLDIYLSKLSNRMNEIMKTLSIIATIFIPLSFIVGYFGMNFTHETIFASKIGFNLTNLAIVLVPVGLLLYFKLRKWF